MRLFLALLAIKCLTACGHATTTMDRELALELAKRPPVPMMQSPPVTINLNLNGVPQALSSAEQPEQPEQQVAQSSCKAFPVYDPAGAFTGRYEQHCYGGY